MKTRRCLTKRLAVAALSGAVVAAVAGSVGEAAFESGAAAAACAEGYHAQPWREPVVEVAGRRKTLDEAIAAARVPPVVYVGETHARAEHQGAQLEMVCRLAESGLRLAVAVEFLQQPFQAYVDDYLAGRIDERALRARVDYDRRWGYPFDLYAPILRFARDRGIPVIALNVPAELTARIARRGYDGLTDAERAMLPPRLDRAPRNYGPRLRASYRQASAHHGMPFPYFEMAQLAWDEGMAAHLSRQMDANPGVTFVVLAGNGHVAWRGGIPERVRRRSGALPLVFANVDGAATDEPDEADVLIRWPGAEG